MKRSDPRPTCEGARPGSLSCRARCCGARVLDDLDRPARVLLDPPLAGAGVALIDLDVLQPREPTVGAVQEERDARPILDVGRMHGGGEHQPQSIH
jgi:hypothetical protein